MTVGGKVYGSVNVSEKLILEQGSRLTGDLVSKILVIEEGANFSGKCEMKTAVAPKIEPKPEVKPQTKPDGKFEFSSFLKQEPKA